MKTLHVVAFEKFLPVVIDCAEAVNPGQNRFVVLDAAGNQPYITTNQVPVRVLTRSALATDATLIDDLEWCDAVFLHPLLDFTAPVVKLAPSNTVVIWCAMGADVYALSEPYRDRMILRYTAQAHETAHGDRNETQDPATLKLRAARRERRKNAVLEAARRVDLLCVRQDDLELEKSLPDFTAQHAGQLSYYTLDQILPHGTTTADGPDILIGNSATWANNHLDLFEQMRDLDLTGRRVVLPLSYGNSDYADMIAQEAHHVFGTDHVTILRDWMPIEDYNEALSSCGTVFMNHIRAQAMGNISAMMLRGSHVWLHPENQLAQFFGEMGLSFSLFGEGPLDAASLAPLSQGRKARNARILTRYWSTSSVHARWRSVFDRVEAEVTHKKQRRDVNSVEAPAASQKTT